LRQCKPAALMQLLTRSGALVKEIRQTRLAKPYANADAALTQLRLQASAITHRIASSRCDSHEVRGTMPQEAAPRQSLCADQVNSAQSVPLMGQVPAYTTGGWPAPQFLQLKCQKAGTRHRLLTLHSDRTDRPAAVRFKFSQLPFAARRGGPHEDVLTRSPCCCLRAAP
jgi:hypothetical protein